MIPAVKAAGFDIEKLTLEQQQRISADVFNLLEANSEEYNKYDFTAVSFFYLAEKFADRIINHVSAEEWLIFAGEAYIVQHHIYLNDYSRGYLTLKDETENKLVSHADSVELSEDQSTEDTSFALSPMDEDNTVKDHDEFLPQAADDQFRLIIEYSAEAHAGYEKISHLPDTYKQKYKDVITSGSANFSGNYQEIALTLSEEYKKSLRPYVNQEANDALEDARSISPAAEIEFKKVMSLVGHHEKPVNILKKLESKYGLSERSIAERLAKEAKARAEAERLAKEAKARAEAERLAKEAKARAEAWEKVEKRARVSVESHSPTNEQICENDITDQRHSHLQAGLKLRGVISSILRFATSLLGMLIVTALGFLYFYL